MAKACVFCGATKDFAKEHVFADWMLRERGVTGQQLRALHHTLSGKVRSSRELTYGSMRLGAVCRRCNNGWMSGLETDVQPVFAAIERGAHLSLAECRSLSTWAFKTAIVMNAWSNYHKLVPAAHYHHLKANLEPAPGVFVDLGFVEAGWYDGAQDGDERLSWQQSKMQSWALPPALFEDNVAFEHLRTAAYVIVLVVDALMIRVTHAPLMGLRVESVMPGDLFRRAWPVSTDGCALDQAGTYDRPTRFSMDCKIVVG